MTNQFRGIRPEDMTKLLQIAEMSSRGSIYASKIADSIDEPIAREVAEVLAHSASHPRPEVAAFARELQANAVSHTHEVAVA